VIQDEYPDVSFNLGMDGAGDFCSPVMESQTQARIQGFFCLELIEMVGAK